MPEFDSRRLESWRCLVASVASVSVMDWLLKSDGMKRMTAESEDIDDILVNIRSFFMTRMGLSRQEVLYRFIPIGSPLPHHIYGVLFADAIRWWAAAQSTGQDNNKYLRDSMYKGEFASLRNHFYHEFRNNQLAHFPGGIRSNDTPFLTPPPYGFLLSQKEYDDFRTILAHSIKLTLLGEEEFELQRDKINSLLAEDNGMSAEMKEAFASAVNKVLGDLDEELLKIPTRNHFPSADEE